MVAAVYNVCRTTPIIVHSQHSGIDCYPAAGHIIIDDTAGGGGVGVECWRRLLASPFRFVNIHSIYSYTLSTLLHLYFSFLSTLTYFKRMSSRWIRLGTELNDCIYLSMADIIIHIGLRSPIHWNCGNSSIWIMDAIQCNLSSRKEAMVKLVVRCKRIMVADIITSQTPSLFHDQLIVELIGTPYPWHCKCCCEVCSRPQPAAPNTCTPELFPNLIAAIKDIGHCAKDWL